MVDSVVVLVGLYCCMLLTVMLKTILYPVVFVKVFCFDFDLFLSLSLGLLLFLSGGRFCL